ncbi:ubiquinone biosynthesis O-methyltransferase [Candidatus Phycosocius bacilliformis]|uniref:Ubiquinone biosynthesis O-methyltransferase n=1 Tax=Candidatus Phycosocius bacilliformis TaxID=1445552 RepID=A0A2P2EDH1_9PROT|nr:class I SAM-dependent methyltransferase [Candidatus Phycosocius bacilliformis]GBF59100.1 ubiquinone biosynthesis O-methyltransferase [Candidatus Phycosocius bacilliformis]
MTPEAYEALSIDTTHWWFVGRRSIIRDMIGHIPVPSRAHIVEIGAGAGGNLPMLQAIAAKQGGSVTAVEQDPLSRQRAIERSGLEVQGGSLPDDMPAIAQSDLILLLDVLEHIEDDASALKYVATLVKPNGHVLITVPAFNFLWSDHDRAHHHCRRYTKKGLDRVLRETGFEIERITYFNTILFPVILMARLIGNMLPMRHSPSGDVSMPGKAANAFLTKLFGSERYLLQKANLPVGVSVLAIAKLHPTRTEGSPKGFPNRRTGSPERLTFNQETHVDR